MVYKFNQRGKRPIQNNISFLLFFAAASLLFATLGLHAQTPTPSPSGEPVTFMGYDVTSSFEFGVRGVSVNGNDNKYRSDFNYRPGFRMFDSSLFLENKEKKSKFVDSFLVNSSGWNADPSGYTRVSVEKVGLYRFDTNVRQVVYFNNLNNHARNGHTSDTRHNFGDFDLTVYPNADKFRLRFGGSFNKTTGTGSITSRAYSDEYPILSKVNNGARDFRAGIDSKLLGFNVNLSYGFRSFRDNTFYSIVGPNPGYVTTNFATLATFNRTYPIKGNTQYGMFTAQRTIAKKLDFTARVIYSSTNRNFSFLEQISGRDSSNNIVDLDRFDISGKSKRPQTRADFGITYSINRYVRVSDTFTFDQFSISGGNAFTEAVFSRTSTGAPRATTLSNIFYDRLTGFRRFANTIEADFQVNNYFSFNVGYRYTKRRIEIGGFNQNLITTINNPSRLCSVLTTDNPRVYCEEESNQTNTVILGMKLKPMKNWVIFGDAQHGDADNAFTRLSNYKFTNLRLRSRWSFNRFSVNVSAITKDNENPSTSTAPPGTYPAGDFNSNTKSRTFSAFLEWTPDPRFSLSTGYTYQRATSRTDIVINIGTLVRGFSEYYMRDHYVYVDVSAKPVKWVSIFASYRYNKDLGQGNRTAALPILITSYPFKLFTGESRLAFRLTRNIEWNLGYQYIGYNEAYQPLSVGVPQDYHANLPYTSLRIYFGGGDR